MVIPGWIRIKGTEYKYIEHFQLCNLLFEKLLENHVSFLLHPKVMHYLEWVQNTKI